MECCVEEGIFMNIEVCDSISNIDAKFVLITDKKLVVVKTFDARQ